MKTGKKIKAIWCSLLLAFSLAACSSPDGGTVYSENETANSTDSSSSVQTADTVDDVPEYSGEPYVEINDNQPEFEEYELTTVPFEEYSELDELGRCGEAEACVGEETMPTEDRESISSVEPTGWENEKYDNVDGGYVYNRCHLIGFQLTGENANEENLITGTRYMNTEGMLPFENMVADYIHETDNHVLYRVSMYMYIMYSRRSRSITPQEKTGRARNPETVNLFKAMTLHPGKINRSQRNRPI